MVALLSVSSALQEEDEADSRTNGEWGRGE